MVLGYGAIDGGYQGHSQCLADGVLSSVPPRDLHLDHDPPLTAAERKNPAAVLDPMRVQFLCNRCHAVKTNKERRAHAA
jgi:hypothetical protein